MSDLTAGKTSLDKILEKNSLLNFIGENKTTEKPKEKVLRRP